MTILCMVDVFQEGMKSLALARGVITTKTTCIAVMINWSAPGPTTFAAGLGVFAGFFFLGALDRIDIDALRARVVFNLLAVSRLRLAKCLTRN